MATNWTDSEVFKLIQLWGEEGIQQQLEGSKRNKHVFAGLSSELAKQGIVKSGEQCRCKVKKLRQEYKKIKDNHNLTGRGRMKWKFYESLNELLGNRPATCPPVVVDTSKDVLSTVGEGNDEMSDEGKDVDESENSIGIMEDSGAENTSVNMEDPEPGSSTSAGHPDNGASSSSRNSSRSATPVRSTGVKGKKRKRSKAEVIEDVMLKVVKTVTHGMKESDKMFLELEEKRMKYEEEQKREERQFQLQMMQMLLRSTQPPSHASQPHAQYYSMYPPYGIQPSQYYPGSGDSEESK